MGGGNFLNKWDAISIRMADRKGIKQDARCRSSWMQLSLLMAKDYKLYVCGDSSPAQLLERKSMSFIRLSKVFPYTEVYDIELDSRGGIVSFCPSSPTPTTVSDTPVSQYIFLNEWNCNEYIKSVELMKSAKFKFKRDCVSLCLYPVPI